jgi:tRNA U34 5-methylaminomethyl-2-thiouridine-forming methyltransferase MnmC
MQRVIPSIDPVPSDLWIHPTRDGSNTLFSHAFGATYHSLYGAVSESRHVFIQHGLASLPPAETVSVFEFGFGTGLNALLAAAWSGSTGIPLSYTGIDPVPLPGHLPPRLDYPAYIARPDLETLFLRMHREHTFYEGDIAFTRLATLGDIPPESRFDCIFFDAFAPAAQPECWSQDVFQYLYDLTAPGGILVTYCAQGEARRRMQHAGYTVERLPGPLGKREMLRARKPT